MLPDNVNKMLDELERKFPSKSKDEERAILLKQGCSETYIRKTLRDSNEKLADLGVPKVSDFYEFYSRTRFMPVGEGEELNTLDGIIEHKESGFHEEDCPGIYDRFLQLSSIEGEGSYFYEIETGIVYDADWGEEKAMMLGTLEKKWPSFYAFLEWYYPPDEEQ
jgi:hypothetical protein